jgi:hypothetical protein
MGKTHGFGRIHGLVIRHYPNSMLCSITLYAEKNVWVYDVLSTNPLNIKFRRVLSGNNLDAWLLLVQQLMTVTLTTEPDKFIWSLNSSGQFFIKSYYADLLNGHTIF